MSILLWLFFWLSCCNEGYYLSSRNFLQHPATATGTGGELTSLAGLAVDCFPQRKQFLIKYNLRLRVIFFTHCHLELPPDMSYDHRAAKMIRTSVFHLKVNIYLARRRNATASSYNKIMIYKLLHHLTVLYPTIYEQFLGANLDIGQWGE